MNQVDDLFGSLRYDFGWHGSYHFTLFDHECDRLSIPGDQGEPILEEQRTAFANFNANRDRLTAEAEEAVLGYYNRIHGELQERLGDEAVRVAPAASSRDEMAALVRPTGLLIQEPLAKGERVVGILCDCSWEPNLGLAVKIVNGRVAEVGDQDIVL